MSMAKAYLVWAAGDEQEGQEVVLASSPTEAKKRSETRYNTDWIDLRVKRYPTFDGKTKVTDKDKLLDGWWFDCPECGEHYSEDIFADAGVEPSSVGESVLCPFCYPDEYGLEVIEIDDFYLGIEITRKVLRRVDTPGGERP